MERVIDEFLAVFQNKAVRINDLNIGGETRCVFILESPHTAEVKYGLPVAGASGTSMARNLFGLRNDAAKPLGLLVGGALEGREDGPVPAGVLRRIGIMNVSPVPLQEIFYRRAGFRGYDDAIVLLDKIRRSAGIGRHRSEMMNRIEELLLEDFRIRLGRVAGAFNVFYVVCGNFAGTCFDEINRKGEIPPDKVLYMPHPSYNSWSRKAVYKQLVKLRNVILNTVT